MIAIKIVGSHLMGCFTIWLKEGVFMGMQLDYSSNDRLLIVNADDYGISSRVNRAITDLFERRVINSASLMVPACAAEQAAESAKTMKHASVSVHLTLTGPYRPVAPAAAVSSLLAADGRFPGDLAALEKQADPAQVVTELRGQVERALAMGLDVTHLDSHQGSVLGLATGTDYLDIVFDLCEAYRLPFLLPRRIVDQPFFSTEQKSRFAARIESAERRGIRLIDDMIVFPFPLQEGETYESYKSNMMKALTRLQPGITQITVHPAVGSNDTPDSIKRDMEYRIFLDKEIARLLEQENIIRISWREVRELQRRGGDPRL